MSIANFVPEFWSARLQRHLDAARVYSQPTVLNRDYEGEIRQMGDTVNIQRVATPTIKTYTKGTPIAGPESLSGDTTALEVDTARYFNFAVTDVDAAQANVTLLDKFAVRAGVAMAETIDASVAATMIAGAGIKGGNLGTSAAPIDVGNESGDDYTFYELAVELRRRLDNAKAPAAGRWIGINPDVEATVLLDPQFIASGDEAQRTGLIGRIAGFDILKTTATPTITKTGSATYDSWGVIFGAGNYATTHASQIANTEAYRPESDFSDAIKGLNLWGDVIEPETLGYACVSKGA